MKIDVYTKPNCSECVRIKTLLSDKGMEFSSTDMGDLDQATQFILKTEARKNRQVSMPLVYVDDEFITVMKFEEKYL